jgi:hypothetical protein
MEAIFDRILTLNLIATTVVFYVAARIYLFPHLARLQPRSVLILWHTRFARRDHSFDGLRSACIYGPGLLDSAFWVPALLVTHYITFIILIKHWRGRL